MNYSFQLFIPLNKRIIYSRKIDTPLIPENRNLDAKSLSKTWNVLTRHPKLRNLPISSEHKSRAEVKTARRQVENFCRNF